MEIWTETIILCVWHFLCREKFNWISLCVSTDCTVAHFQPELFLFYSTFTLQWVFRMCVLSGGLTWMCTRRVRVGFVCWRCGWKWRCVCDGFVSDYLRKLPWTERNKSLIVLALRFQETCLQHIAAPPQTPQTASDASLSREQGHIQVSPGSKLKRQQYIIFWVKVRDCLTGDRVQRWFDRRWVSDHLDRTVFI